MYRPAGDDVSLVVRFIVDGEFVTPDENSIFMTVRDHEGVIIPALHNVPVSVAAEATETVLLIEAAHNAKTQLVENRYITVKFTVENRPHVEKLTYTLVDWISMTASEQQVRASIGLTAMELGDPDIDLIQAYYKLVSDFSAGQFAGFLIAGDRTMFMANRAIVLQAALDAFASVDARIAQREKSDTTEFWRRRDMDPEAIRKALMAELSQIKQDLRGGLVDLPPLFTVTGQPDPFLEG